MPETPAALLAASAVEAYYYINQSPSAMAGEPQYWEWKRQQVMSNLMRAMVENKIDWRQQDQEDR